MAEFGYSTRTRGLFDPKSKAPFKLSRSKIDLFTECPRCFYLDRRLGVPRPSMPGFTLNVAVDHLLKKEFDIHRANGEAHPLMTQYGVNAVPFQHNALDDWRNNFKGVQYTHDASNFLVFGAVDDLWVSPEGKLHVVDYKATSKAEKPTLDGFWQQAYKRQIEIYQWLLRGNGFDVSNTGYFVYVNGRKDAEAFDGKLEFDIDIISYVGDDSWVEQTLLDAQETLSADTIPPVGEHCEHCPYREEAGKTLQKIHAQRKPKTKD